MKGTENIAEIAIKALEIFAGMIEMQIDDYKEHNLPGNIEHFNKFLHFNIKDMVVESKNFTDTISEDEVLDFINYYNKLNSK